MIFVLLMLAVSGSSAYMKVARTITSSLNYSNDSDISEFMFQLHRGPSIKTRIDKRRHGFVKPIRFHELELFIDIHVGNPPQHIEAILDLKYRGVYVTTVELPEEFAKVHLIPLDFSENLFNPEKSLSYSQFSQFYLARSFFLGAEKASYCEDDLYISNPVLEKFKFLTIKYSNERSVIGLGVSGSCYYMSDDSEQEDSTNIFEQLKALGWASKCSFSLWIGNESSRMPGMIIFNGLDKQYIRGKMYVFPLLISEARRGYFIKIDALLHIDSDGIATVVANFSIPAELNFNVAYSSFPTEIVAQFYAPYGWSTETLYQVLCEEEIARGAIGLVFSGVQFAFPFSDIIPECQKGSRYGSSPFSASSEIVLGANFLSVLYMAFDLDNKEVGLALARTNIRFEGMNKRIIPIKGNIPGETPSLYSSKYYNHTSKLFNKKPLITASNPTYTSK